jgi:hypothetical protein
MPSDPIPEFNPTKFDKADIAGIKAHFDVHGYAVVQTCDPDECTAAIAEQVREILNNQPWMEKLVVKDRTTGDVLDIDRDTERFVKELTTPGIPKEALKHYDRVWPMHRKFGACCDPSAFHLKFEWKLRQDESLYAIARAVMEEDKLYVTIDRCIHKLPGKGDKEFLHWDLPILNLEARRADDKPTDLCLKICFTDAEFICVPGTHKRKFAEDFKAAYQPHYPKARKTAAKFGMDPKKPDPMGLRDKRVAIKIPAGCSFIWSPYMLHGTTESPEDGGVTFGMYMGYMTDIDRHGYQSSEPGITSERKDRNMSYMLGRAPACYPSMDPTYYFPKRFYNFHKLIKKYVDMTPPGYAGRGVHVIKSGANKGTAIPVLLPVLNPNYVPYPLTTLGKQLLGVWPW